jgi:hypothetical protein
MSDWQGFAQHGDPEQDGNCRRCGRTLACTYDEDWSKATGRSDKSTRRRAGKPGGYRDDHFCGLRCGYQFAVRLADLGRRLAVKR